ncbi:uncharacterized protein F5Z01DRAFT_618953 [Emericellopsis atlantica]|uniref:Protein NO VEIN C-terminal domain-containing protein n=1 Tax=Emericellopsis atlantica TaxID=2614577 RepID=A0A9P8CT15_9HYPO|nr:uncharacterized protein F5Z01DRAFT_618953 [Emericellopsis atlantica]KAG9256351.1 hypothetical protein F5Z01DRAFT_618953 [Emericellopsis atlantica]
MSALSREEARTLVQSISTSHGFVDYQHWQAMAEWDMARKRIFEDAFLRKDQLIGSAVITLAKNLYTSEARFLFELLQNCEDNHYKRAAESGNEPFVVFEVYKNRVICECNEDGFTKSNLSAICNIGRSSKSGTQAYIGEKGIGFKSVFKVAYKAVIHSGNLCFSFTHNKRDSGMGMISPQWEEGLAPGEQGRTRITLWLHEQDSKDILASINEQLKVIHEEMLLFMRKIKRIVVRTYDDNDQPKDSSTYSRSNGIGRLVSTERLRREGEQETLTKKHFHLTTYTARGLPKSENREYNNEALESESYATSEIVLAFPLDEKSVPVLQNQWLFSFLPATLTGFKFVIQADFVTGANRESIDTTSPRNQSLGHKIPAAFVLAVLQMCEHETLQYRWMRYLPSDDSENAWGPFWTGVIDGIKDNVKVTPVLRPASLGPLRKIGEMRRNSRLDVDHKGQPLFPDIAPEKYLSPRYAQEDLELLKSLGLENIFMDEILARARCDLDNARSRLKTCQSEEWHTRAAKLFQFPFQKKWDASIGELKQMNVLPLRGGNWASVREGPVYYADSDEVPIPEGLRLRVINPSASNNPERKKLFDLIGVATAPTRIVLDQIRQRYREIGSSILTPGMSLADMHFAYLTSHAMETARMSLGIKVFTNDLVIRDPSREDVFLPSDDALGASHLLSPTPDGQDIDDGAPGYKVPFLHDDYLLNPPVDRRSESPRWVDWLHDCIHIRRNLRLKERSENNLSKPFLYVAKHRPKRLMSLLHKLWQKESEQTYANQALLEELSNIEVVCRGGRFCKLKETFFPTSRLEDLAKRFLSDDDPFLWLELHLSSDDNGHPLELQQVTSLASKLNLKWQQDDLQFSVTLLEYLGHAQYRRNNGLRHCTRDSSGFKRVRDLYIFLDAQVRASADEPRVRETLRYSISLLLTKSRRKFQSCYLIFIPAYSESQESDWYMPNDCVWTAPVERPRAVAALEEMYGPMPGESSVSSSSSSLKHFFCDIVQVTKWNWELAILELEEHQDKDPDFDSIICLYKWLAKNKNQSNSENIRYVHASIIRQSLVYKPNGKTSWHKSSECLWTAATVIPSKTPINNEGDYDGLESFFQDVIGVQKVTLRMLYDKLSNPDLSIPIDGLKGDLLEFSALLGKEDWGHIDAAKMCKNRIFPVRRPDGEVFLSGGDGHFAIVDRAPLAASFRDKALLLDFDIEQVRGLEQLFRWANLQDRYLSTSVREIFVPDRISSRPISEPERRITAKAGTLLSIAKYHQSPRVANGYDALYKLLRNCDTLETRKITTTLLLHQGGTEPISHDKDDGVALVIDESSQGMKVFVPRKRSDREACFQSKLPKYLFEWIMTNPDTNIIEACADDYAKIAKECGIRAVQAVLSARICALNSILLEFGIPDAGAAYADADDDDSDEENSASVQPIEVDALLSNSSQVPNNSPFRPQSASVQPIEVNEQLSIPSQLPNTSPYQSHSAPVQPLQVDPLLSIPSQVPNSSPYRSLLEALVNRARTIEFPSRGTFDMFELRNVLDGQSSGDPVNRLPFLRPFGRLERDKMVGAAGELFMFELLRRIEPSLPEFGLGNWQSNIRGYASAHPEFAAISSWGGAETADITYRDHTGAFTSFLADKGYLESYDVERQRQARPLYYLEVKSTPYSFNTAFFMNGSQFRRMQDCSQSGPGQESNLDRIYVLLRVFDLGMNSASVRVLVDPEGMRRRGELHFEAESWKIRPRRT